MRRSSGPPGISAARKLPTANGSHDVLMARCGTTFPMRIVAGRNQCQILLRRRPTLRRYVVGRKG